MGARATELSPASPRAEDQRRHLGTLKLLASLNCFFLSRRIEFGFFFRYSLTSSILTSSHPTMSSQPLLQTAPGKSDTNPSKQLNTRDHSVWIPSPSLQFWLARQFPSLKLWMSNTAVTSTLQEKQNERTSHPTHTTTINPPISTPSPANINQASELPSQPESNPRSSSLTSAPSSHGLTSPSSWAA